MMPHPRLARRLARTLVAAVTLSSGTLLVAAENCPQPRFTGQAPQEYYVRTNPLSASAAASERAAFLFEGKDRSINCVICHGKKGGGDGPLASQFDPPPRNFSCAKTVDGVPDGQLFWIIRFGSPNTAMPPHRKLKDEQIWELVLYLRQLAK